MGTLGSYFKNAREARGLDLRDAAQQTRISIAYLKAIEEEDFSKLPGEVFVRGFLKNYARFLRLPEEELVKLYVQRNLPPQAAAPSSPAPAPRNVSQKKDNPEVRAANAEREHPGGLRLEPFLWAGVILIGMFLFVFVALPARKPIHEQGKGVSTQLTTTDSLHDSMTSTIKAKAEKLYLEMIAQEDVWVLVRTDAGPQKKAVLKKGESITWSADERFLVSYTNVGSLKISLNGKELTVNGPKNAVVRDLNVTALGIAFQKVESEQPRKPRKPKPLTQETSTVLPQAQTPPAPPVATDVPPPVNPVEPTGPSRE